LLSVFFYLTKLSADSPLFIYLNNNMIYRYIDYQINSGKSVPDFAFQQPLKLSQLGLVKPSDLNEFYIKKQKRYYGEKNTSIGLEHQGFLEKTDSWNYLYRFDFNFHYRSDFLTLGNRTRVDRKYKYDPYYAGDLSEADHWIYGRVNDAYLTLDIKKYGFFIGKINRNWGPVGEKSLILSDNPYSFDHFMFTYTGKLMMLTTYFSQLDFIKGTEYHPSDSTYMNFPKVNRYLTGHRLDISISNNFQIGLTEMAIYGGENRDIELAYLNPMTFYYGVQRNDRKDMSGLWAMDIMYKPIKKVTLYGQFLIDDIIVNNDPGVDDRARYPDRLGLMISARSGDLFANGLNLNLTYIRIWNRTYQSLRNWECYQYRGLGIGYPSASCEEYKFKLGLWKFFPMYLESEFEIGRYGDVNVSDIFPCVIEKFPVNPTRYHYSNSLKFIYNMTTSTTLGIDVTLKGGERYLIRDSSEKNNTFEIRFYYDTFFMSNFEL